MDKGVVIAFGRFNPPTIGHAALLEFVKAEANRRKSDVVIFPSTSQDARKNPLPFREKVAFMRQFFPDVKVSGDANIKTPLDALMACSVAGYDDVCVVVGSDRVADFEKLAKYVKPRGRKGTDIVLKKVTVLAVPGNRDPDAEGVAGMSASKMRAAAADKDIATFRQGVPKPALAKQLFDSVRKHMKLNESAKQQAFLLLGPPTAQLARAVTEHTTLTTLTPRDILLSSPRYTRLLESKLPFAIDMCAESTSGVQMVRGRLEDVDVVPTIYVYQGRQRMMSEDALQHLATLGTIRNAFQGRVVDIATPGHMIRHMNTTLAEVTGAPKPPKSSTEVERLQASQKQQTLMLKGRQAQELLQAKQRELARKSREDMMKNQTAEKQK